MANPVKVMAVAGSLRAGSFNRKLLELSIRALREHGAEVEVLTADELRLPLYDGDLEARGMPPEVVKLKERVTAVGGLAIASPEYNASIPGGLKNWIDWLSRPPGNPFKGKVVALLSASPGQFGGARVLPDLRKSLCHLAALVLPGQVHIARANEAFDDAGGIKDPTSQKLIASQARDLVELLGKLV